MNDAPLDFLALLSPTAKQIAFLQALRRYRYVLYGGARGGGKSRILRWAMLWLLLEWYLKHGHKNVKVAIFCEDYPSLKDRQISKIEVEFPKELGELKESQADGLGFHLREEYGGGVILLRNLDKPSKYMSAEFAAIAIDELSKHPLETFNVLRGSLRWPGIDQTLFLAATNPGGPGHLWVKALWVDRVYPDELKPLANRFHFIRSLPSDNPHLGAEYWAELNSLPEALRNAWVLGLWDAFLGQAFTEWQPAVHLMPQPAPQDWTRVAGMDWGIASPGWFGLFAQGPRDRLHLEWEFAFGQGTKRGRMLPYDVGLAIGTELNRRWTTPEFIVLDKQCWADQYMGQQRKSEFEELQRGMNDAFGGSPLKAPQFIQSSKKTPKSRASRLTLAHARMDWKPNLGPNGKPLEGDAAWKGLPAARMPRLTVHPRCEYFIATVPSLPLEEGDPTVVDTEAQDHAFDGWTYLEERLHHDPMAEEEREDDPNRLAPIVDRHRRKKRLKLGQAMEDEPQGRTGYYSPYAETDDEGASLTSGWGWDS